MFYLFILFYFICHTIITKNIGKEEKKKWRGDLTETIGAYERLGLLELWARAVSHQLKKRRRKVEDGKTYELFSYLLNNLIFSFFLKEERDWELMTLLSSELKNWGPWKKGLMSEKLMMPPYTIFLTDWCSSLAVLFQPYVRHVWRLQCWTVFGPQDTKRPTLHQSR